MLYFIIFDENIEGSYIPLQDKIYDEKESFEDTMQPYVDDMYLRCGKFREIQLKQVMVFKINDKAAAERADIAFECLQKYGITPDFVMNSNLCLCVY